LEGTATWEIRNIQTLGLAYQILTVRDTRDKNMSKLAIWTSFAAKIVNAEDVTNTDPHVDVCSVQNVVRLQAVVNLDQQWDVA
jgi:hypothetical protein